MTWKEEKNQNHLDWINDTDEQTLEQLALAVEEQLDLQHMYCPVHGKAPGRLRLVKVENEYGERRLEIQVSTCCQALTAMVRPEDRRFRALA